MVEHTIQDQLQNGIIAWYPFREMAKVLYFGSSCCALYDSLRTAGLEVDCFEGNPDEFSCENTIYDYVIGIHTIELVKDPVGFLRECKKALNVGGRLLLAMDNRLGIRYFCGDQDPYTGRVCDSIENYRRVSKVDKGNLSGQVRDRAMVETWLQEAGFRAIDVFSVLPNIDAPQLIYEDGQSPQEELAGRYFTYYNNPDTVFMEEASIYETLIRNNMFHQMANGYLLECALEHPSCDTKITHVTLSMDRGEKSAMATVIYDNQMVIKKPIYSQGIAGLKVMDQNHKNLAARGIKVVEGHMENGAYTMPFVDGEIGTLYLQELLRRDKETFVEAMDEFRELILRSSEHIAPQLSDYERLEETAIANGVWLEKAYYDMVPLNAFRVGKDWVFFDQEFALENSPANGVLVRAIDIVYSGGMDLEEILPREVLWERYKMTEQVPYLRKKMAQYIHEVRNQDVLAEYNEAHRVNYGVIHSNRQPMNFSAEEYRKLFVDVFEDLGDRKLVLFGSGKFSSQFVSLYGSMFSIEMILDNDEKKWGTKLEDITIESPEALQNLDGNEYKVVICIKNYLGVLRQLKDMGVLHIGIYDPNMNYHMNRVRKMSIDLGGSSNLKKKYKVGYVAGVFDLFHIGHLNMFRRAKEQCEYLIVGVVTDEGVRKNKKTVPFIPFEERIEMVRACKYVDEAVEIPFSLCGTKDAFRRFGFDVQFSGSDYAEDPHWLREREFLRKHGAELIFFPYTEQTSSTKIKALIEGGITGEY